MRSNKEGLPRKHDFSICKQTTVFAYDMEVLQVEFVLLGSFPHHSKNL